MQTTVKLTKGKKKINFKIREQRVEGTWWKKLLYFSCECGCKGQYEELNIKVDSCPKCKKGVAVLERCPQCKSPSMTSSVAGIVHAITTDEEVWEIWPCKKCQSLLINRAKKVLGFVPSILFY